MTDCAICTRHHPTADGDCGDRCHHTDATIGLICDRCHLRILRHLTTIETAWHISAGGAITTGRGGGNERSLPGGTEWLNWRQGNELRGCLVGWARVWHEDADADLPWPATTIEALLTWLRIHLHGYGAHHEAVADFAAELSDWARAAARIIGDTPTGQIVTCPGIVEDCGQRLRVNLADPDAEIHCRRCATTWTAGRLLLLGTSGDADAWADSEAIHAVTGIPERTLRDWGAKGTVRRRNGLYHVGDVQAARIGRAAAV